MPRRASLAEPAPNKVAFTRLIDEQCERLGYVQADGQPDRRALSAACGLSPTTLHLVIKRPGRPDTRTLLALEARTGVAVNQWLAALELIEPAEVDEETLTPAERDLLNLARRRGDRWVRDTVRWLRSLEPGDSDHG